MEGSHSGLVRAPAKRLLWETGVEGSNPSPSATPAPAMNFISRLVRRIAGPGEDDGAPQRLPSPDELVLLTRPNGEPDAQPSRQLLEREGIRSMIKNRDAVSAESGGIGPPWAYELWVLRRDLRRAREVLDIDASGGG